jgi:hypothetical protein
MSQVDEWGELVEERVVERVELESSHVIPLFSGVQSIAWPFLISGGND